MSVQPVKHLCSFLFTFYIVTVTATVMLLGREYNSVLGLEKKFSRSIGLFG